MFNLFKKNKKKIFRVNGMQCASCAMVIESDLEDVVIKAKCSYAKQTVEIDDNGKVDIAKIKEVVTSAGYGIVTG